MIERLEVSFEPHHLELRERVKSVAWEQIEPIEREHSTGRVDEDSLARRFVAALAEADLLKYALPTGRGSETRFDLRSICIIREGIARSSGFADVAFAMQGLGSAPISLAGNNAQRDAHLAGIVKGTTLGAFALTEPEAGSDVAAISTRATRDGDFYRIDGTKTFISNAGVAGLYTLFARTAETGRDGLTAFIVPADTPGLEVVERQEVIAPHPIGTLRFENCRVPVAARLGQEGEGFSIAMRTLDVFRPTVGAAALGLARRALAEALDRSRKRVQFGTPIGKQQAIQFYLADMATDFDAASLLVYRVATSIDRALPDTTRQASMAKLFATEAAQRIIDHAVQIHGGSGVLRGSVVERLYREIRALRIYEGTTEIQHLVIGRGLWKGALADY